ncbi:MAG: cupin domain-containing protein [Acidobacteriota bacterium]|nr:cupin domain-containing protein [Acidobacteriota bacterium]
MSDAEAQAWIRRLDLTPHAEGGYFREIYRSMEAMPRAALPGRFPGDRVFSTSIYFLLAAGQVSLFHRLRSDEIWHHYEGGPAVLHVLDPGSGYQRLVLGRDAGRGQSHQRILPAGCWFGAELDVSASFLLAGCTLAPGFEYADFELAGRAALTADFPGQAGLIARLTPDE